MARSRKQQSAPLKGAPDGKKPFCRWDRRRR